MRQFSKNSFFDYIRPVNFAIVSALLSLFNRIIDAIFFYKKRIEGDNSKINCEKDRKIRSEYFSSNSGNVGLIALTYWLLAINYYHVKWLIIPYFQITLKGLKILKFLLTIILYFKFQNLLLYCIYLKILKIFSVT